MKKVEIIPIAQRKAQRRGIKTNKPLLEGGSINNEDRI
jgi:hypothetical protein